MPFALGLMNLAEFDEFLMSDDAPNNGMMPSDLDGFLTAVASGPELITFERVAALSLGR